jgi:hypothetical protein
MLAQRALDQRTPWDRRTLPAAPPQAYRWHEVLMNPAAKTGSKQNSPSPPLTSVPPRHDVRGASVHDPIEQSWLQTD